MTLPANAESYTDTRVIPGFIYYYRVKALGDAGDSDYSEEVGVRVRLSDRVEDLIKRILATIQVYPNPTDGRVTISWETQLPTELRLRILDIAGQERRRWTISSNSFTTETDMSDLPEGIYFLEASADGKRVLRRLVVKR